MKFLLGLDIGSTVIKAVVFDRSGRAIAMAEEMVSVKRPHPGWVERDAATTWRVAAKVLREVANGRASQIAAVGVTGCGNGAVFLDQKLRAVRAGILSSDTRATAFMPRSRTHLGQQPYPGQLPGLSAWLHAYEPKVARRVAHAVFWKDFIRAKLTGQVCSDYTDAGAAGMLVYPRRVLRETEDVFPPLQDSFSLAGECTSAVAKQTGLRTGTPVVTGCIDCEAVAMGSGVRTPGEISVVAGTWSVNQTYVTKPPRGNSHFLVNESAEPGRWLVVEGSPSSMSNFDWACRTFGVGLTVEQAVAEAARSERSDLLFFPEIPTGHGAFTNLTASHGRGEMLRAVMEGIVFAHRAHLEKLPVNTSSKRRVTLAGGAARSPFWCQLFADGLGLTVDVPRGVQLGALGAAICAGIGVGLWPSVSAAQKALVPKKRSYRPHAKPHAALNRDYARYRRYAKTLTS